MSRAPIQSIAFALPILASIALATAPSHAANGTASCRFRAGGSLDQIVMIDVPQGAKAATVTAIVEESPELSGSTRYSRDSSPASMRSSWRTRPTTIPPTAAHQVTKCNAWSMPSRTPSPASTSRPSSAQPSSRKGGLPYRAALQRRSLLDHPPDLIRRLGRHARDAMPRCRVAALRRCPRLAAARQPNRTLNPARLLTANIRHNQQTTRLPRQSLRVTLPRLHPITALPVRPLHLGRSRTRPPRSARRRTARRQRHTQNWPQQMAQRTPPLPRRQRQDLLNHIARRLLPNALRQAERRQRIAAGIASQHHLPERRLDLPDQRYRRLSIHRCRIVVQHRTQPNRERHDVRRITTRFA